MTQKILDDNELRILFKKINSIVMIGVSASPLRASYFVARYFVLRGISVIPINPNYEGKKCGEKKF
jgi:predicted CoA-binding protein